MNRKTLEIVDEVSEARLRLVESVAGLSAEQMDYQPAPEVWSIGEVLHHLALADESTSKLLSLLLGRAESEAVGPDPAPEGSVLRSIDHLVEGAAEGKARAPDRVTPRSHLPAAEALSRLEASRARILKSAEALGGLDGSKLTFPHPFFGELDFYQWLLVTGWHERRHTKQIERVKSSSGFPGGSHHET